MPYGNVNLLPIPDDVADEQVIYLSDVLPTSYHSVVDTGVQEGDVVGIWGGGPIGQCAARWAFLKGAKRVIVIDQVKERLDMAQKCGADVLDFTSKGADGRTPAGKYVDIVKFMHEEYAPGGLDVALDCGTFHEPKTLLHKAMKATMLETDVPETINECIMSVRKMGRVGLISA